MNERQVGLRIRAGLAVILRRSREVEALIFRGDLKRAYKAFSALIGDFRAFAKAASSWGHPIADRAAKEARRRMTKACDTRKMLRCVLADMKGEEVADAA